MLTFNTVFTSLVALHALLASTGKGQVEANVLRRATAGHSGRQSYVIRGLLNVAGHDESFQRRQSGCKIGFYPCSDGTGCCPNGQTCDYQDGFPICCCIIGGGCPSGELPCSANVAVCCPKGDLCSSDGSCSSTGGGGGGGTGNGGGGSGGGSGGGGTGGGGTGGGGNGGGSGGGGTGGGGTGSGGNGGGSGGSGSTTSSSKAPGTISPALPSSSSAFGGGPTTSSPLVVTTPGVVTVTATPGPTGSSGTGNGEVGRRAGTATVVMMGSVLVATGLALLIF